MSRDQTWELLLGVCDLHGAGRCDSEALQRVFSHARLRVAFKLHKGDVVFPRDEPHLFETRKPAEDTNTTVNTHTRRHTRAFCQNTVPTVNSLVEQHGEHHLVGLLGQVVEEQDVVWWVVRHLRRQHRSR